MIRTFSARIGVATAVLILTACTSSPVAPPSALALERLRAIAVSELRETGDSGADWPDPDWKNPYASFMAVSPAMDEFVRAVAPASASPSQRLEALFDALRYTYVIEYHDHATLTAAEAFRQQRANCLSFSAMFIAMARAAGLDARFQEVDVPPTWDGRDDQVLIQYRHVNVRVRLGRGREAVIDLRIDRYSESYPRRLLSDAEALAHYHSNLSMDSLIAGDLAGAERLASRALMADDGQSFVWNNMGIIQRRQGELALAETSYRQALALNHNDWSALSNLAYIFEQQGNGEEATRLRALSDQTKLRNPLYRYALAQQAFRRGDYRAALSQLNEVNPRHRNDARFLYLRSMSQWQLGEAELAMAEMGRAISLATDGNSRASYERQLAEWQGAPD